MTQRRSLIGDGRVNSMRLRKKVLKLYGFVQIEMALTIICHCTNIIFSNEINSFGSLLVVPFLIYTNHNFFFEVNMDIFSFVYIVGIKTAF